MSGGVGMVVGHLTSGKKWRGRTRNQRFLEKEGRKTKVAVTIWGGGGGGGANIVKKTMKLRRGKSGLRAWGKDVWEIPARGTLVERNEDGAG